MHAFASCNTFESVGVERSLLHIRYISLEDSFNKLRHSQFENTMYVLQPQTTKFCKLQNTVSKAMLLGIYEYFLRLYMVVHKNVVVYV